MSSLSNNEAAASPPAPPLPPPLPPLRYGNRAANAIVRFAQPFIYGSRPPSAEGNRHHESGSSGVTLGISRYGWDCRFNFGSLTRSNSLGASRTTTHKTGIPIAALDISPDRQHAIVAGRDILKTIRIFESSCVEDVNLRSRIVTYAATHNTSGSGIPAKHKDQLAANDVKWSPEAQSTTIATAAANGQVVIYDLNRAGLEFARLHEHNRQVHKLAFNPYRGVYLLSGSQDATVRLWDLRVLAGERSVITFGSMNRYSLNNEGIRDLRWSPKDVMEFAAGTDNGVIQRWDFRRNTSPLLKINAHEKTCHSIDWHPDGKHLASGGADKNVKVWDFSSTDRRMKACWQLRAPQAIREVRWRPAYSPSQSSASGPCTQLATSYDHQDPRIHVWDFRRPYVPAREIDRYDAPATAMLWRSKELLWSVGSAGMFTQTDISHTSEVAEQRNPNIVAVASDGTLNIFSEKRAQSRRIIHGAPEEFFQGRSVDGVSGERLSGSQSILNGSFDEPSLLSSSFKSRQPRIPSSKSSKSIASTPPSINDGESVVKLDEALQKQYLYRPTQHAASGNILGVFDAEAFKFLARHYMFPPKKPGVNSEWNLHRDLPKIFQANAMLAASVGQHRLAQSWRILGMALGKELGRRAELNRETRLQHSKSGEFLSQKLPPTVDDITNIKPLIDLRETNSMDQSYQNKLVAPLIVENGSNVTTPLARPISDLSNSMERHRDTAIFDEDDENFRLPTPAFAKQSPRKQFAVSSDRSIFKTSTINEANELATHHILNSSLADQQHHIHGQTPPPTVFLDLDHHMNERRAAVNNYRAQPRPLLRLDDPFHIPRDFLAPSLGRHDSNESFQMFSASTDSSHRAGSMIGSFGSSRGSEGSGSTPEKLILDPMHGNHEDLESNAHPDILLEDEQPHQDIPPPTKSGALPYVQAEDQFQSSLSEIVSYTLRPTDSRPPIINVNDFRSSKSRDSMLKAKKTTMESYFVVSDFAHSDGMSLSKPWTASAMLAPLINYHITSLSDTQMPAFLILYLAPYLSLSIPSQLELSILLNYHEQLSSLSLYCEASHLRNLVEKTHPEVTEHGTYGITPGGPWCTVCRKPSKGDRDNFCERCKKTWGSCPVCDSDRPISPLDTEGLDVLKPCKGDALWSWCQGCGHGGHVGCLRTWWDDPVVSEGNCATIGCLHDCVAGIRRDELLRKTIEDKRAGLVQGDEWVVGESRAVEKARHLVGSRGPRAGRRGQASSRGRSVGRGPLNAGLGGRSGSGSGSSSKKVRLLVPEVEGESQGTAQVGPDDRASASAP